MLTAKKEEGKKSPRRSSGGDFSRPSGVLYSGQTLLKAVGNCVEGRRQLRVNRLDRGHPVLAPGDEFGDDEVPREDLHDERDVAQALELFREWSQAFRTGRKTDFRKTIGVPYE